MESKKMKNKTDRVFKALVIDGEELTAKQISKRFNVSNPHDSVYQIRMQGYPIYLNKHKNLKGQVKNKYRFGTASRKIIASGYKALASGAA